MHETKLALEILDIVYFWPIYIRNVFKYKIVSVLVSVHQNADEHNTSPVKHDIIEKPLSACIHYMAYHSPHSNMVVTRTP